MKRNLMIAIAIYLSAGSIVMASNSAPSMHASVVGNGYVTVERSVVMLPVRLQTGDQLELFTMQGTKIMSKEVGIGYISQNLSAIPMGVYTLVIERGHHVIATRNVPVAGTALNR